MKLKFKKQGYQTAAVEAVADCFAGQPFSSGLTYRVNPGRAEASPQLTMQAVDEIAGFKNADLAIPPAKLLENIQAVQRHQNLPLSDSLATNKVCDVNLDIEMETGTGKTYCYIKTMFELNKRYGWTKFIVVVPSIAKPASLRGLRVSRFQATFNVANKSTTSRWFRFGFNIKDQEHFGYVQLRLDASSPELPAGRIVVDGQASQTVSFTSRSAPPTVDQNDWLWFRVTSDGTTVRIYAQASQSEPSEGSWSSLSPIYVSDGFDLSGGSIGFLGGPHIRAGQITIAHDTTPGGDGTYDTVEHIDDFAFDGDHVKDTPTHDAAGNLTYDGTHAYTYDAWNRLVATAKAYRDDTATLQTGSTVQQLEYDALGRRIVQQVQNSADLNRTEHYYHAGQSVVEVRNGSGLLLKQQLWAGTLGVPGGYIDQLLQLAVNADPFATDGSEDVCEAFFYALHDANYNLLALVDDEGAVAERYEYTPYGQRTVYFSPGTNDPLAMAPTTMSRRWDVGGVSQPYGLNTIGHQGLSHDAVTGLVHNRARMLHPRLGRFMQRDPMGYVDGMSLYAYYAGMHGGMDPTGTELVRNRLYWADGKTIDEIWSDLRDNHGYTISLDEFTRQVRNAHPDIDPNVRYEAELVEWLVEPRVVNEGGTSKGTPPETPVPGPITPAPELPTLPVLPNPTLPPSVSPPHTSPWYPPLGGGRASHHHGKVDPIGDYLIWVHLDSAPAQATTFMGVSFAFVCAQAGATVGEISLYPFRYSTQINNIYQEGMEGRTMWGRVNEGFGEVYYFLWYGEQKSDE